MSFLGDNISMDITRDDNYSIPSISIGLQNSTLSENQSYIASYSLPNESSLRHQPNDVIERPMIPKNEIRFESSPLTSQTNSPVSVQNMLPEHPEVHHTKNINKSFYLNANPSDPMVFVPLSMLKMISSDGTPADSRLRMVADSNVPVASGNRLRTIDNSCSSAPERNIVTESDESDQLFKPTRKKFQDTAEKRIQKYLSRHHRNKQAIRMNKNKGQMKRNYERAISSSDSEEESAVALDKANLHDTKDCCKVCAEPAGQHVYYGAKSCQSCRAFFRRSVEAFTRLVSWIKGY